MKTWEVFLVLSVIVLVFTGAAFMVKPWSYAGVPGTGCSEYAANAVRELGVQHREAKWMTIAALKAQAWALLYQGCIASASARR